MIDPFIKDYFTKESLCSSLERSLLVQLFQKINPCKAVIYNVYAKFEEELYKKKYDTSNCMIKMNIDLSSEDEIKNKKVVFNQSKKQKSRKKKNKKQNESNETKVSNNDIDEEDEEIRQFKHSLQKNSIHKFLVYKVDPINTNFD